INKRTKNQLTRTKINDKSEAGRPCAERKTINSTLKRTDHATCNLQLMQVVSRSIIAYRPPHPCSPHFPSFPFIASKASQKTGNNGINYMQWLEKREPPH